MDKADNVFLRDVKDKLDQANSLIEDLDNKKEKLSVTRDNLIEFVQPLNELDEREVKQPEIDSILSDLD